MDRSDERRVPMVTRADATPNPAESTGGISAPDKAMRVGQMARQLLEEVRSVTLDESGRARLRAAHERSVRELADALSPELADELCTLMAPIHGDRTPSESELMIVQAQLVGWLEGLFQGVRASVLAQQLSAQHQLDDMRRGDAEPSRRGTYL